MAAGKALAKMAGAFDTSYDGGEFCRGLILAKEGATIFFKITNYLFTDRPTPMLEDNSNVAQKKS